MWLGSGGGEYGAKSAVEEARRDRERWAEGERDADEGIDIACDDSCK